MSDDAETFRYTLIASEVSNLHYQWVRTLGETWEARRQAILSLAAIGDETATWILNAVIAERMR